MLALLVPGVHMGAGGSPGPEPEPPPVEQPQPRGRAEWLTDYPPDRRSDEDIRKARQRFGVIPPDAEAAIAEVAIRQAARIETDAQKRYDELIGELRLREIEFEARYLEALNTERERLINEEIASRLHKLLQDNNNAVLLMMLMAAAAAS